MDSRMFDGIVRNLDTMGTRRKALMALTAGGLSLGLPAGGGRGRQEEEQSQAQEEAEEQALSPAGQHLQRGRQASAVAAT